MTHARTFLSRIRDAFKRGQRTAYYWSFPAMRAIRMGVNEAELFIATDKADLLAGHPMKG